MKSRETRFLRPGFQCISGVAACLLAASVLAVEAPDGTNPELKHFVPVEKNLTREWIRGLYEKGEPETYSGNDLDVIGMPVGGIGAGQLYLRGDGTLGCWRIFNRMPDTDVGQGFAVIVEVDGKGLVKKLNRQDFPAAEFRGEYPVGTVRYRDESLPVEVRLEAFTPFIPLNAGDSGLPATLFHITVRNVSEQPVRASVVGWLENAVCRHSADRVIAVRRSRILRHKDRTLIVHTGEEWKAEAGFTPRENILLADFEGEDYGDWKTTGTAFGTKPVGGRSPTAGTFQGKGLVDTYIPAQDGPQGTLTSPEFVIERPFLNFLVAGGAHEGKTCMNLLVDGKVARTVCGRNNEQLAPQTWDVTEFAGRKAQIQILDLFSGGWGHINVDHIELSDLPAATKIDHLVGYGSMALGLAQPAESPESAQKLLASAEELSRFNLKDDLAYLMTERRATALATPAAALAPGEERAVHFVLTWYFPNHANGHVYASRFEDAAAIADYVLDNHDRLAGDTRTWRDTYYNSTLPVWLLDRLQAPVSTLATETCEWWKDGRFWAWEGVLCCHGTCAHVWNYEHAMARLFPELERNVRVNQDLGVSFRDDGMVGFRGDKARYAADGQAGTVLKCYREHLTSPNAEFLEHNWPRIKKALEFLIEQDGDDDGLIENSQHNTFDIEFYGPNTFVGSLYLAALRAGEEMAREMGDTEFAARAQKIVESGKRLSVQRLYNGEYFIQLVDLEKHPGAQYADGCLADQMFGQGWAHQVGLGYIYPAANVRSALASIWRYNWAPDIAPQNAAHRPERWFVANGEPGLFICTWPKSLHREGASVRYRNEVWTGIEYQVAGHMVWEGLLDEALTIVRAVHERYQPSRKRNPYNEVECGGHYARAMASWGVFTALSGFEYHGPKGHIGFSPRITPEDFRAAFTAAEGWGTFTQNREGATQHNGIEVRWGRLQLKTLAFSLPEGAASPEEVTVTLEGKAVKASYTLENGRLLITLAEPLVLKEMQPLNVLIRPIPK